MQPCCNYANLSRRGAGSNHVRRPCSAAPDGSADGQIGLWVFCSAGQSSLERWDQEWHVKVHAGLGELEEIGLRSLDLPIPRADATYAQVRGCFLLSCEVWQVNCPGRWRWEGRTHSVAFFATCGQIVWYRLHRWLIRTDLFGSPVSRPKSLFLYSSLPLLADLQNRT